MFEELNERRKAVERNIAKGFGIDDVDLDLEKALEDEFEKGRAKKQFNIGDTFTRHGITYKCTGISPNTGRPTWSKVKDGEGGKQEQSEKKEKWEEEKQDCAIEWMEFTLNGGIKKKRKEFDSQDKARSFIDKISKKDSFYQITATSGLDDSKPLYKQSYANTPEGRQQAAMDVLKESGERIKKQMKQKQEDKKDEQQKPKKLSELKRGDTVALIMERYNPQLGNYVTIKKVQIEGTTSKSFKVDYMKFDKETGERSDKSSSVYGSSTHYILLPEEVNSHIKDGKWKGDRISGGNPFEDE